MPMLLVGSLRIPILQPLLQLAGLAHLVRRQPRSGQGCIKLPIPTKCGRDVSPKRPCLREYGRLGEASLPNKRA